MSALLGRGRDSMGEQHELNSEPCSQLVIVAVYLISLMNYCEGEILQADIGRLEGTGTEI